MPAPTDGSWVAQTLLATRVPAELTAPVWQAGSMLVSRRRCNRATLARQLLLERAAMPVDEAVRAVLALQAQEPASVHLALWARVEGLEAEDVDRMLAAGTVVRATLMRVTLHAVHASDHQTVHRAMTPTLRAARLNDRRFRATAVTPEEADAALAELLAWADEPRTNEDAQDWLTERGLADGMVWWAMRQYGPLRRSIDAGSPWSFSTSTATYQAIDPTPPVQVPADAADAALGALVERYLAAFGPATVGDVSRFALVPKRRLRPVVAGIADRLLDLEAEDGRELLDVPDAPLPPEDTPAPPRLLPMWDSVLFAHEDRTWIIDDDVRALVIRRNGDTLPPVLVDGRVVGVWRPAPDGGGVEVTTFRHVADEHWEGLVAEARSLLRFVGDRDPRLYGRYRRWWDRLPEAERVILTAG